LVDTFSAKPWLVIHRLMRTPMAAIFSSRPDARLSLQPPALDTEIPQRHDQGLFDVAHVAVHVAPIRPQVEDRVTDELARAVIGDVAAASCFEDGHALRGQRFRRRHDVRGFAAGLDAEGDDGRVFEQKQRVGDRSGPALVDQSRLQIQALAVVETPEAPHVERARRGRYTHVSSKF
jgi:hypothetical protein